MLMKKVLTLCVIHKHSQILLGMKKRGFGEGRWNGFGGKVEKGERIIDAAKREVYEEAGISVKDIKKAGMVDFEFQGNPEILRVHIFRASEFDGKPKEGEEMRPKWFNVARLPFKKMWPDDRHWFPLFLDGKKFRGKFLFDESDNIVDMELKELKCQLHSKSAGFIMKGNEF